MRVQLIMILSSAVNFYCLLIFVWVILSWFKNGGKVVREVYRVLDTVIAPYVNLFRKFIPPMGGLDFSPFIALIVLQIVSGLIFRLLI
ncbi:MAG: YggT family protein [Coriobacteriales bacterium]|nr:YggT family protein [Coriobacteriales bacterium]